MTTKVVEQCRVSPPPATVATTIIPLTHFDVFWLSTTNPVVKRIFFYECTTMTSAGFLSSHLPALSRSLSLTLQLFFGLAGHILLEDGLVIEYADGDSVPLFVAESDGDFAELVSDEPKDVKLLHPLLPRLPLADERCRSPLLALQFTVFPGAGVSLGLTFHHSAADGNSIHRFLKSWAAIHRSGGDLSAVPETPVYDRGAISELEKENGGSMEDLEKAALAMGASLREWPTRTTSKVGQGQIFIATYVLVQENIEKIRGRIMSVTGIRPSTFVAVCSHVWVSMTKAWVHEAKTVYLSFVADCRRRVSPPLPEAYFGNCGSGVLCEATSAVLAGPNGLVVAAKVIREGVQVLEDRPWVGLREVIDRYGKVDMEQVLFVVGSPLLRAYETDFGWGPPKKTEATSIEGNNAVLLTESRGRDGGLEIGIAASLSKLEHFGPHIFNVS